MTSVAGARTFVVDAERRIVSTTAPDLRIGERLTTASWLGAAALAVVDAVERTGAPEQRVGRDYRRGEHWLVCASPLEGEPWRASVVAIDATAVASADRDAIFPRLVHTLRNVDFALRSVLDAIDADRPTGPRLDEYLSHLPGPLDRLTATMTRLAACVGRPRIVRAPMRVDALFERALASIPSGRRPAVALAPVAALSISGDLEALADAFAAVLDSGVEDAAARVEVCEIDVHGRRHVSLVAERTSSRASARDVAALWDLGADESADALLRLAAARAVIEAHEGDVSGERSTAGGVRLGVRVPLMVAG